MTEVPVTKLTLRVRNEVQREETRQILFPAEKFSDQSRFRSRDPLQWEKESSTREGISTGRI